MLRSSGVELSFSSRTDSSASVFSEKEEIPLLDEGHQQRKKSDVSMREGLIKIVQSAPLTRVR